MKPILVVENGVNYDSLSLLEFGNTYPSHLSNLGLKNKTNELVYEN